VSHEVVAHEEHKTTSHYQLASPLQIRRNVRSGEVKEATAHDK
jgi:hypothetical protein